VGRIFTLHGQSHITSLMMKKAKKLFIRSFHIVFFIISNFKTNDQLLKNRAEHVSTAPFLLHADSMLVVLTSIAVDRGFHQADSAQYGH
jgi:hypothetical protein